MLINDDRKTCAPLCYHASMDFDDRKKVSSSSEYWKLPQERDNRMKEKTKLEKKQKLQSLKLQMLKQEMKKKEAASKPNKEREAKVVQAYEKPGSAAELAKKEEERRKQEEQQKKEFSRMEQETEGAG